MLAAVLLGLFIYLSIMTATCALFVLLTGLMFLLSSPVSNPYLIANATFSFAQDDTFSLSLIFYVLSFNKISTGLGLYLSKKIINDHKGKMLIKSTQDGINTFGFTIPKN